MKVLVTGATGFVGREIVGELIENNFEAVGLGRSENKPLGKSAGLTRIKADITDNKSLSELEKLKDIAVVVHSAGLAHQFGDTAREEFEAVNVQGTENILAAAVKLQVRHFILISSTAVYGAVPTRRNFGGEPSVIDEDTPTDPQTLYAESKLKSEEICRRICEANNIPLTILRLAPVIGEANVGNVARLIEAIDKRRFLWIGDGSNLKSLIYKRDVARACVELIGKKHGGTEMFNLAAQPICMKTFVNEIAARLERKIFPAKVPPFPLQLIFRLNDKSVNLRRLSKLAGTVEKWLSDDVYSADRIAERYEFRPQTSISEALQRQIDFYKSRKRPIK